MSKRQRPLDGRPPAVQRKLAVLGGRAVGKTALMTQFAKGRFEEIYEPTMEQTFQRTVRFKSATVITELVDSAGLDENSRLSRNASVGVHGYLLIYSSCSRPSFEGLRHIHDALISMQGGATDIIRVLVATMSDMREHRQVAFEEGQRLADHWGVPFLECSSKDNCNVTEVFTLLLDEIERDYGVLDDRSPDGCAIL